MNYMNFKNSLFIIFLCLTATLGYSIPEEKGVDHDRHLSKRNFIKDLDAKEKNEMSKFALNTLNSLDPTYSIRVLCKVMEGKKQFASGIVFKLKLLIVVISEEDYDPSAKSEILCDQNEEKVVCEIDVLRSYAATDYSPINAQVVKSECENSKDTQIDKREVKKRGDFFQINKREAKHEKFVVGGKTEVDPKSEEIQKLASTAVAKLDTQSGSGCTRRVDKVLHARTQVVAGTSTDLIIEVCPDSCINKKELNENNSCQICSLNIWEKPWEQFFEVSKFKCNDVQITSENTLDAEQLQFESFVKKYKKSYENEAENQRRFHIFRANLKKIQKLNDLEQGTAFYAVNEFADLTRSEFKQHYLGLKPTNTRIEKQAEIPDIELPTNFDWRTSNKVTPVKNQGMCGSCWAFSTIGNIEGQWAIKTGQLESFSEQELVDCDHTDQGCQGGYMTDAYVALEKLGGLESEKDYPYEGVNDKCIFNSSKVVAMIADYVNISSDETKMAKWLVQNGPISVALNAFAMQFYFRGISHPWKFLCNPKDLDHGVLIVGFGVSKKTPYWIVKNSWGKFWGEQGYYRLYRGAGTCGINQMATSAILQ